MGLSHLADMAKPTPVHPAPRRPDMPSTLAWIDHDTRAQDRAKRILALFQERGTVDQLGLGGIRDSFADLFFPGTSTIQTRLRYFLFVPWIYQLLEEQEVSSRKIAGQARELEVALIQPLLSEEETGIFGGTAGGDLKRLPSEIYWGGLGNWGIRRFDASQAQYHRHVDELYRLRKSGRRDHDEDDDTVAAETTWHPELPPPPVGFPEHATIGLSREEAEFLRDRIVAEHPDSLLRWLVLHPGGTGVRFPWEHPLLSEMPSTHRADLRQARLFSEAMAGAPILYNRMLAELLDSEGMVAQYDEMLGTWIGGRDLDEIREWSLDRLFETARRQRLHTISVQAEHFVREWVQQTIQHGRAIHTSAEARELVRRRERALKRARSLFDNRRAREERYQGGLGIGRLDYRWPNVKVLLNDLYDGLGA